MLKNPNDSKYKGQTPIEVAANDEIRKILESSSKKLTKHNRIDDAFLEPLSKRTRRNTTSDQSISSSARSNSNNSNEKSESDDVSDEDGIDSDQTDDSEPEDCDCGCDCGPCTYYGFRDTHSGNDPTI